MPLAWNNSFPITMRELLVASRKPRTYWDRVVIGGLALLMAASIIFVSGMAMLPQTSTILFQSTHWLMLFYCFIAGAHTTCDCISWEKREGTLGLLYLSNMSAFEIILGKLTIATVQTLFGLMVCFPLLALPILMGGVTMSDVVRTVLASMNLLFFSSAAGIFCSVLFREKTNSGGLAAAIMVTAVLGPWFYLFTVGLAYAGDGFSTLILLCMSLVTTFYPPGWLAMDHSIFYTALCITHLYGWLLIVRAARLFPRCFHEKSRSGSKITHGWKYFLAFGSAAWRAKHRQNFLNKNAFAWLASRRPWIRWQSLILCAGGLGLLGWYLYVENGHPRDEFGVFFVMLMIIGFLLKAWIGGAATQTLAFARDEGTLEWMLSTPLDENEMVRGQIRAIVHQFGLAIGAWFLVFFAALWASRAYGFEGATFLCFLTALFFLLDCYALTLLGMWKAITSKQTRTSAPDALARGLILPHITSFMAMFIIGMNGGISWAAGAVLWFVSCALVNAFWIIYISQRFGERLRERAQNPRG